MMFRSNILKTTFFLLFIVGIVIANMVITRVPKDATDKYKYAQQRLKLEESGYELLIAYNTQNNQLLKNIINAFNEIQNDIKQSGVALELFYIKKMLNDLALFSTEESHIIFSEENEIKIYCRNDISIQISYIEDRSRELFIKYFNETQNSSLDCLTVKTIIIYYKLNEIILYVVPSNKR